MLGPMMHRRAFFLAFAAALALQAPSGAQRFDPRGSYTADEARDRREDGRRLPMGDLRDIVRRAFPGCDIINDELFKDRNGDPVAYRARIVTREGRLLSVNVDPRTGRVTRVD